MGEIWLVVVIHMTGVFITWYIVLPLVRYIVGGIGKWRCERRMRRLLLRAEALRDAEAWGDRL